MWSYLPNTHLFFFDSQRNFQHEFPWTVQSCLSLFYLWDHKTYESSQEGEVDVAWFPTQLRNLAFFFTVRFIFHGVVLLTSQNWRSRCDGLGCLCVQMCRLLLPCYEGIEY